jgi:hypothetical protein
LRRAAETVVKPDSSDACHQAARRRPFDGSANRAVKLVPVVLADHHARRKKKPRRPTYRWRS